MGLWGVVVAVGLLVGCAVDPVAPVDSGPVCPPEQVSRAGLLADEIKIDASLDPYFDYLRIDRLVVFRTAQWADMYPACFSDEARVWVYALRDKAQTAEGQVFLWKDDYEALLAALYSS